MKKALKIEKFGIIEKKFQNLSQAVIKTQWYQYQFLDVMTVDLSQMNLDQLQNKRIKNYE